jgi:16S rRNA (cytosine967-C5)-methyltransferase
MSRSIKTNHPRSLAALVCEKVIDDGISLGEAINQVIGDKQLTSQDRGFIQALSFGVLRWYWQLEETLKPLLNKPIRNKERQIKYVLLLGLFQLQHLRTPEHAAVSDTVKGCKQLGKPWAKNLVNACLRNYLRQIQENPTSAYLEHPSHPTWIHEAITKAWPKHAEQIFSANNSAGQLCLRVNSKHCSQNQYLSLLKDQNIHAIADPYSDIGIRLENSIPVSQLPKFEQGWVSVQDTASQVIAKILSIKSEQRVLDACAAPGGKTSLIMENSPDDIEMHAIDIGGSRNNKLNSTLRRLKLNAKVIEGDASKPEAWWDGKPYQCILIDAPCSGLGVIRRHPDIKHLRKASDIQPLIQIQAEILDACWNLLEKNGTLLYTSCSILPEENEQQIKQFLERHQNAQLKPFDHPTALKREYGKQTLPGISEMDGFYYCLLHKESQ